jgi:hypothetical protein
MFCRCEGGQVLTLAILKSAQKVLCFENLPTRLLSICKNLRSLEETFSEETNKGLG